MPRVVLVLLGSALLSSAWAMSTTGAQDQDAGAPSFRRHDAIAIHRAIDLPARSGHRDRRRGEPRFA